MVTSIPKVIQVRPEPFCAARLAGDDENTPKVGHYQVPGMTSYSFCGKWPSRAAFPTPPSLPAGASPFEPALSNGGDDVAIARLDELEFDIVAYFDLVEQPALHGKRHRHGRPVERWNRIVRNDDRAKLARHSCHGAHASVLPFLCRLLPSRLTLRATARGVPSQSYCGGYE